MMGKGLYGGGGDDQVQQGATDDMTWTVVGEEWVQQ